MEQSSSEAAASSRERRGLRLAAASREGLAGETLKYHFILFYRCSYGSMNTGELIIATDRQGVIQDYKFKPIWAPSSPRASNL